jgi:4-amino-4-deoxy-L-arabinose transferase-like glycosyltransferase
LLPLSGALFVLALALTIDHFHFANGIAIEWRINSPSAEAPIALGTTVEHDVSIHTDHRPLTRYVELWRVAEHGMPRTRPRLDAVVHARLLVPRGPARGIEVRTPEDTRILIDGVDLNGARVAPGWHDLDVHWTGVLSDRTAFELVFEDGAPIPRSLLHVPGGDWPSSRGRFWGLAFLLSLLVSAMVQRAERAPTALLRRARMLAVATLAVVLLGTGLRAYQYDSEPHALENYDEYFNLWNGWSLIEDGTSRGWSAWPSAYRTAEPERESFRFWGTPLVVVSPYFENPPLMHVLVGLTCHLMGVQDYRDAHSDQGRLVSLALSALTIWLLILVTRRLVRAGPGPWFAGLLYAVIPTLVLQTRMIKEELVVIPLALGTLYFFLRWQEEGRRDRDLYLAACCAGIAVLAKVPGAILVPGLVMLLVARGDARAGLRAVGVSLLVGALPLMSIAIWQGLDVFLAASAAQSTGRGLHFNLYARFVDVFQVNGWLMGRGWLIFLWLAAMSTLYAWSPTRRAVIAIPLALYLTTIGVGAGNNTLGWYLLPIAAYLCIAAGAFLGDLYERPDLLRGAVFGLFLVMYTANFLTPTDMLADRSMMSHWIKPAVMLTVVALIAPYCAVQVWPRLRPLARGTFALSLTTFVVMAGYIVLSWEDLWPAFHNMDRTNAFFP